MLALYVLLGILVFLAFILLLKATVTIEYRDDVVLAVSVLGIIRIRLLPAKQKKVRLGHYSKKKIERRKKKQLKKELEKQRKKQEKKEAKKLKKERKKNISQREKARKSTLAENLEMIKDLLAMFFTRFFKHFRIKVARLHIDLSTGDPASTAILYGAVCQAVCPIAAFLEKFTNINELEGADISVNPNFTAKSTSVDIKIAFSLRVWHLVDIGLRALKIFIKTKNRAAKRAAMTEARAEMIKKRLEQREALRREASRKSQGTGKR